MNYLYKKNKLKTILFLHGWGGSIESFRSIADFLYDYGYSILLVDFLGFGQSEEPPKNFTIYDYAKSVKNLLKDLQIDDFYIVAHSFGGRVTSIINQDFKIDKMVLTGSAGLKTRFSLINKFKILKYKLAKFLVKIKIVDKNILKKYGSLDYKNLSDDMKQVFVNVVNEDLKKYIKNIKSNTLLYWGDKDTETPLYMGKRFKKFIKNSRLYIVNGSHFAYIENSFEFQNLVLEFFNKE